MSEKVGKKLSFILRHRPDSIGIVPDAGGWVDVEELLALSGIFRADFDRTVASDEKSRFTLADEGRRVRAAQGHSIPVDLGIVPSRPPDVLFHGTADRNLDAILEQGLLPRSRQQVHLSEDMTTALSVGSRHGSPVVLSVDAAAMHGEGIAFVRADNGVWLVDAAPSRFLSVRPSSVPSRSHP